MKFVNYMVSLVCLCSLIACNDDVINGGLINESSFTESEGGWAIGVTDFDTASSLNDFELSGKVATFPSPLPTSGRALLVQSTNKQDTLFTFLTKKITGLVPSQRYQVAVQSTIISRLPQDDSLVFQTTEQTKLYFKGAVSNTQPMNYLVGHKARLNLHTGSLGENGIDFKLLYKGPLPNQEVYTLYSTDTSLVPFLITPNNKGEIWVTLGTQTAFQGMTQLYYDQIKISIDTI